MMSSFIGFCRNPHKNAAGLDRLVAELQRAIRNPARDPEAALSKATASTRQSGRTIPKE